MCAVAVVKTLSNLNQALPGSCRLSRGGQTSEHTDGVTRGIQYSFRHRFLRLRKVVASRTVSILCLAACLIVLGLPNRDNAKQRLPFLDPAKSGTRCCLLVAATVL